MTRIWVRIMLFCSSYFPLAVIFAILNHQRHPQWALSVAAFGIFSVAVLLVVLVAVPRFSAPLPLRVQSVQQRDSEILNYIAAYIIPFVTIPFDSWENGVAVGILLVVLCIVYVNSNMIAINPMLTLLGYHLYQTTFVDDDQAYYVMTRHAIRPGMPVALARLGTDLYLQQRAGRRDEDQDQKFSRH